MASRKEAREEGEGQYEGKECAILGHGGKRYLNNNCCVKCEAIRVTEWKKKKREEIREYNREYRRNNPRSFAEYLGGNKERERERVREWRRKQAGIGGAKKENENG